MALARLQGREDSRLIVSGISPRSELTLVGADPPESVMDLERVNAAFRTLIEGVDADVKRSAGMGTYVGEGSVTVDRPPELGQYDEAVSELALRAFETGIDLTDYGPHIRQLLDAGRDKMERHWRFMLSLESIRSAAADAADSLSVLLQQSGDTIDSLDSSEVDWLVDVAIQRKSRLVLDQGLQTEKLRSRVLSKLEERVSEDRELDFLMECIVSAPPRLALTALVVMPREVLLPAYERLSEHLPALRQLLGAAPSFFDRQLLEVAQINLDRTRDLEITYLPVDPLIIEVGGVNEVEGHWRLTVDVGGRTITAVPYAGTAAVQLRWSVEAPDRVKIIPTEPLAADPVTELPGDITEEVSIGPVQTAHGAVSAWVDKLFGSIAFSLRNRAARSTETSWYGRRYSESAATSPEGRWAAFSWWTDKNVDHSWIEVLELEEIAFVLARGGPLTSPNPRQLYPHGDPDHYMGRAAAESVAFSTNGRWFGAADASQIIVHRVSDWPTAIHSEPAALRSARRWAKVATMPRADRLRTTIEIPMSMASPTAAAWLNDRTLVAATEAGEVIRATVDGEEASVAVVTEAPAPLAGLFASGDQLEGVTSEGHLLTIDTADTVHIEGMAHISKVSLAVRHRWGWFILTEDHSLHHIYPDSRVTQPAESRYRAIAVSDDGVIGAVDQEGARVLLGLEGGRLI